MSEPRISANASASSKASANPGEALARTMRQIYELGLTTTSGGNLSLRADDGSLWITPAGIDKGELRGDQVARVMAFDPVEAAAAHDTIDTIDMTDTIDTTATEPSSELPFHRAIYAARPDLRAVVHAHPVSLVAFSIAQQVPDTRVSAFCHALCGTAGFAAYALPGSPRLGDEIAATFAEGFDSVVLENHGVVVAGATLREAFERLEALDLCARTIMRARAVGEERLLSADDLALGAEPDRVGASRTPSSRTDEESTLRQGLCSLARRAHARRLVTSRQGALSARLAGEAFLLTPADLPLDQLEPSDLLRVNLEDPGPSESDSRSALFRALYRAHPEVRAIAHGYGENTAGFSTAGLPLPARTIPESYILVREPGLVLFREARLNPERVADVLCPDRPVALVQNEGALALGASILDAFDRLEVLEATAAAVIASGPLGKLAPMNDAQLEELRKAFFPTGGFQGSPHGGST